MDHDSGIYRFAVFGIVSLLFVTILQQRRLGTIHILRNIPLLCIELLEKKARIALGHERPGVCWINFVTF